MSPTPSNPPPLLTRRHAQAQRQMGLAGARFADQHHRLRPPDIAARGKVGDPRRRHRGLLEVELGQGLDPGQTGFLDPTHHARRSLERNGVMREFFAIDYGNHTIWGATAAMVVNLSERLGLR